MSQEVIVAVEAALQAGKILRERVDDIGKVSFKEFHAPVTEVDHLAEKAIITRIKKTLSLIHICRCRRRLRCRSRWSPYH